MNYYLYKLDFSSSVHFGTGDSSRSVESADMILRADTVFSALCHTAVKIGRLVELVDAVGSGDVLFSDTMPFCGDELYIPKPSMPAKKHSENSDPSMRKKMKKLKYIPISMLSQFTSSLKGEGVFNVEKARTKFGQFDVKVQAAINGAEDTEPYSVGTFTFYPECGLYGIIGYNEDSRLELVLQLFDMLGYSGVGGRISSGLGKFSFSDISADGLNAQALMKMLKADAAEKYILLTSSIPNDDELDSVLEGSSYTLIRRGGFTYTDKLSDQVKKNEQYFFAAGSVFDTIYGGDLYDVGNDLPHPVYRYSKPIFLGVTV